MTRAAALFLVAVAVLAHGDHDGHEDDPSMSYAERHMHSEHHIDSFDLPAFFKLHDLNMDGYWDRAEIAALYGLRHHSVLGHKDEDRNMAAKGREAEIVGQVLKRLDVDLDGRISLEEYLDGGKDGLPNFDDYKNLGHHYDEESEYFLHHEELFHSTPETQTDESYTHPEDIEHFKHHEHIEDEEDARERIFEGLDADADLTVDHDTEDPLDIHAHAPGEGPPETSEGGEDADGAQEVFGSAGHRSTPRIERVNPGAQPNRLQQSEGLGGHGGRRRSAEERLRADAPYKYKFRKGLRADEF